MAFERILFRATRGNVFLKQVSVDEPVVDPVSGEKVSVIDMYSKSCILRAESFSIRIPACNDLLCPIID